MEQKKCYDETPTKGIKDNLQNEAVFQRLPTHIKYFIESTHNLIMTKVKNNVNKKFGEEGLKNLVKTSGFRSVAVNSAVGGVSDSLHLWGAAIDFAKIGIFKENPIPTCCNLECIDSGKCWHVQLKRNI